MKKHYLIITLSLNLLIATAQGTWVQKSSFPSVGRENAAVFSIGDNGYVGIGNNGGSYFTDFWEYNTSTDTWTQKTDFPGDARSHASAMSIGSSGYIGLGTTGSAFKTDFFEYNPGSGAWVQKTSFAGNSRQDAVAFRIGDKGYLGTGRDGSAYYKDFWEYNPATDAWTQKADLPGRERKSAIGFGINDKGYIGLGFSNVGDYRNEFYEYNPAGNYWTSFPEKEEFPGLSREYAVSFGADALGRGYVMCGYRGLSTYTNDCWEFIQATREWKQLPAFSGGGRSGAVGFIVNGTAYVGLGKDASGNYLTDFWALQLPTAADEISSDFGRMYPSPVRDNLFIETEVNQAVFSLYDLTGKKIMEINIARGNNSIPLAHLKEGNYLYKIENASDHKISSGKILKVE